MKFSPGKCYKDLLLEYLSMVIGDLSYLPGFENYHPEYLKDYSIEYLEKLVKKFSKKGHTYFAFVAGIVYAGYIDDCAEKSEDVSDEEIEEFLEASQAGLNSLMTLLGIEDISTEEMFDMVDSLEDDDDDDDDVDDDVDEDDKLE